MATKKYIILKVLSGGSYIAELMNLTYKEVEEIVKSPLNKELIDDIFINEDIKKLNRLLGVKFISYDSMVLPPRKYLEIEIGGENFISTKIINRGNGIKNKDPLNGLFKGIKTLMLAILIILPTFSTNTYAVDFGKILISLSKMVKLNHLDKMEKFWVSKKILKKHFKKRLKESNKKFSYENFVKATAAAYRSRFDKPHEYEWFIDTVKKRIWSYSPKTGNIMILTNKGRIVTYFKFNRVGNRIFKEGLVSVKHREVMEIMKALKRITEEEGLYASLGLLF
jgi:hypothetical protein